MCSLSDTRSTAAFRVFQCLGSAVWVVLSVPNHIPGGGVVFPFFRMFLPCSGQMKRKGAFHLPTPTISRGTDWYRLCLLLGMVGGKAALPARSGPFSLAKTAAGGDVQAWR